KNPERMIPMTSAKIVILTTVCFSLVAQAQQPSAMPTSHHDMGMHTNLDMGHEHQLTAPVSLTFAELQRTASQLEAARRATRKYRDVQAAERDGYRAIGPDVPGMGIHYVQVAQSRQSHSPGFDIEHPEILLYEKDPFSVGGFGLVGVSYL